ncbi:HAD-IIB family hydrolase [Streptomyces africanus]|uniref:HAD-IIB family hydrolase n=1 Tax=Streptomyces africanus TaxID=231024 RepID=UPI000A3CC6E6|nr:HAD-IIB family hydrolase [Streptomyces africanus]
MTDTLPFDATGGPAPGPPPHLRLPEPAVWAAFSDFDETYLAHAATPGQRAQLAALEEFLLTEAVEHGLLFGWVTGSSLASVREKMARCGARVLPHFVAGALGTELTFFPDGVARPDPEWRQLLRDSGFDRDRVTKAADRLARHRVELFPQNAPHTGNPTEFLVNYYFRSLGDPRRDERSLDLVRDVAREHGLGLNISRCNPATGDPADCYDVDFLPPVCGKRNVVRHLCARFGVAPERTLAFGDSGNDLEMLGAVGHGYLVANCTPEARSRFPQVSPHPHAQALLTAFRHHLRH